MKRESLVLAVSGAFFGLLVGWILGSQQSDGPRAVAASNATVSAPAAAGGTSAPPALDEIRASQLQAAAERDVNDVTSRVGLGNLYFDAERYPDAIRWYEAALGINPNDPDVSTDLGVSYYYSGDPDRALVQFAHSLEVDPRHLKTLLNSGIVLAFGKQDLDGAMETWERLVEIAPDSPEGQAARQAVDSMRGAHPGFGEAGGVPSSGGGAGGG